MMRDNNLLSAGIMLAAGAGVAAGFGWLTAAFYLAGVVSAIVAAAIVISSNSEDWS